MKVVITGAAGRLGRCLAGELAENGHEVIGMDAATPSGENCWAVTIDLRETAELSALFDGAGAVIHLARIRFPYTEKGFDRTNGTWTSSDVAGDARRFNDNVAITNNVLVAAGEAGVKKIVCGSSLAVYGFYYPARPALPDYLPVDEEHPLRPQDPYGLSKLAGEALCDAAARKHDVQIASLRFSGIYAGENAHVLAERKNNPVVRGTGALWSYVDVRDAAAACRLALQAEFSGHEAFNICAPTTIMDQPTEELVRRYLPKVARVRAGLQVNWCGYHTEKAERMLGFRARHLFRDGALR